MKALKSAPQILVHAKSPKAVVLTVEDCIGQWCDWLRKHTPSRTYDAYRSYIQAWARDMDLEDKPIAKVDEDDISEWVNDNSDAKRTTRTVKLSVIRSLFRFLVIKAVIGPDPSRLVRLDYSKLSHEQKERHEIVLFSDADFRALLNHLDEQIALLDPRIEKAITSKVIKKLTDKRATLVFWKCAAVLSRCAGLRLGDVCQLEWACFKKDGGLTVWTDKRNVRVAPHLWNPELFAGIQSIIPADDAQYCFPKERKIILSNARRNLLSTQFGRLCEKAGLAGRTFHGLRHSYCTECHRAGIPTPHIATSVGHSSISTTQQYIH